MVRSWRYAVALGSALALAGCAVSSPASSRPDAVVPSISATEPSRTTTLATTATATTPIQRPQLQAKLDQARQDCQIPGLVLALRTPQGTWVGTSGTALEDSSTAIDPNTMTRIGSVTKTFTATVLLQLADEGVLSLDTPIGTYFPTVPNATATLRQLALMLYGVASFDGNEDFSQAYEAHPTVTRSESELIAEIAKQTPVARPGELFLYSNSAYVLLGAVIEKVTHQSLADLIKERITTPLGMTKTSYPSSMTLAEPALHGMLIEDDKKIADVSSWSTSIYGPAGMMTSSVNDMLIWAQALGTGRGVLSESAQRSRLSSVQHNIPGYIPAFGYGLGLMTRDSWLGHEGLVYGYSTWVAYNPTTQTSVVIFANTSNFCGASGSPAAAVRNFVESELH
ncbi:MAG: serine hydrolase domain-containing protein [Propionibacteriaceae bacterium]